MALVLVPEDGSGLPNANSLISYANSLAYYERVPPTWAHAVLWNAANQANREIYLVKACDLMLSDALWNGYRKSTTQRLPFPRLNLWVDGVWLSSDIVPEMIQFANAEFAGQLMVADRTVDVANMGITRLKVDVIELVFDKSDRPEEFPPSVQKMLAPYGNAGSGPGTVLERW